MKSPRSGLTFFELILVYSALALIGWALIPDVQYVGALADEMDLSESAIILQVAHALHCYDEPCFSELQQTQDVLVAGAQQGELDRDALMALNLQIAATTNDYEHALEEIRAASLIVTDPADQELLAEAEVTVSAIVRNASKLQTLLTFLTASDPLDLLWDLLRGNPLPQPEPDPGGRR